MFGERGISSVQHVAHQQQHHHHHHHHRHHHHRHSMPHHHPVGISMKSFLYNSGVHSEEMSFCATACHLPVAPASGWFVRLNIKRGSNAVTAGGSSHRQRESGNQSAVLYYCLRCVMCDVGLPACTVCRTRWPGVQGADSARQAWWRALTYAALAVGVCSRYH